MNIQPNGRVPPTRKAEEKNFHRNKRKNKEFFVVSPVYSWWVRCKKVVLELVVQLNLFEPVFRSTREEKKKLVEFFCLRSSNEKIQRTVRRKPTTEPRKTSGVATQNQRAKRAINVVKGIAAELPLAQRIRFNVKKMMKIILNRTEKRTSTFFDLNRWKLTRDKRKTWSKCFSSSFVRRTLKRKKNSVQRFATNVFKTFI